MQRAEHDIATLAQRVGQLLIDPANLRLPWQEHQHTAGLIAQRVEHRLHHARFDELARLEGTTPLHRHREHPPFAADHWRVIKQTRQPFAFQRRRHQQNFQRLLVPEQRSAVKAQGQCQVRIETPF
jgi:hypothetical protein